MTQHSDLEEGDAAGAASSLEDELEVGLGRIAAGLIALAGALRLAEVIRTIARHAGKRLAARHPLLAELEWEARHHHRH